MVLPWSAWRDAVRATPPRRLPYAVEAQMVAYGMRAVSHPPDWDNGTLYVDSYLPRRRRGAGTGGGEMRQVVRLPNELPGKAEFLSVLCEELQGSPLRSPLAVFSLRPFDSSLTVLEQLDSSMSKIAHAYWYLF